MRSHRPVDAWFSRRPAAAPNRRAPKLLALPFRVCAASCTPVAFRRWKDAIASSRREGVSRRNRSMISATGSGSPSNRRVRKESNREGSRMGIESGRDASEVCEIGLEGAEVDKADSSGDGCGAPTARLRTLGSWSRSSGLVRKSSMPAARHFSRSPAMALAVRAITKVGGRFPNFRSASRRRISRAV